MWTSTPGPGPSLASLGAHRADVMRSGPLVEQGEIHRRQPRWGAALFQYIGGIDHLRRHASPGRCKMTPEGHHRWQNTPNTNV